MTKYFVKASSFKHYKSDVIEAVNEEYAIAFYKAALKQGHVPAESEEFEFLTDVEEVDDE